MTGTAPSTAATTPSDRPPPAAGAPPGPSVGPRWLAGVAWAVMLVVSDLPEIVLHHAGSKPPAGFAWAKLALLLLFLGLTLAWRALRPLLGYAVVLSALVAALNLTSLVRGTGWFQSRFNSPGVSFFTG